MPEAENSGPRAGAGNGAAADAAGAATADQELRESERRFRGIFENAAVGMAYVGLDGRVLLANQRLSKITGYPHEELVRKTIQQLTHPEDLKAGAEQNELLRTGAIAGYTLEKRYLRSGGDICWVNLTCSLHSDAAGLPEYFIATVEDITSRKAAEEAEREARARLQRVLGGSHDGFWECTIPPTELFVSARWCEITGLPPEDGSIRIETLKQLVHPDDLPSVFAAVRPLVMSPEHGDRCEVEHRILRPNGRVVWVAVRATASQRDASGVARQISGLISDITERKRAGEALHRFELLAGNSRDIILFMRRDDGRILEANVAAVQAYGYSREELLSLSIQDLRSRETLDQVDDQMDEAEARTILFETFHRRKDGSTFPVEVSARGDTVGGTRTLISVVRDITERKRAEEVLRQSEERFRQALENIPDVVLICDRDLRIRFANGAVFQLAGIPPSDCIGQRDHEVLPLEVQQVYRPMLREVLETRQPRSTEAEIRLPVRGPLAFRITCVPLIGERGEVREILAIMHDFTDRRRGELQLAEAKSRQETLAEVVGRLLASEDPRNLVKNLALKVMAQLDCQVFVHFLAEPERGRLFLNGCAGIAWDQECALEWLDYGVGISGCVARDGCRIVAEDIGQTEDPRARWVKSYDLQAYACHPLIAEGQMIGTLAFGSRTRTHFTPDDLALMQAVADHIAIAVERIRTHKALRKSEALYRGIASSIPDGGVWVVDREMRFLVVEGPLVSRLGPAPGELEGRLVEQVVGEQARANMVERFGRALAGEAGGYETDYDDVVLWAQYVPLRDETGSVVAAMVLILDVTERKRVEQQMRHAQKLESIGVLAGGVAHDFNNLLTSILGNASLAQLEAPPEIAERLNSVIEASERAAGLTRQLLAYAGKGRFEIGDVDLLRVIHSSAGLIRVSIPKSVSLFVDVPVGLPPVRGDAEQIQQVVMNLVINAAEAIGPARTGTVTVSAGLRKLGPNAPANVGPDLAPGRYVYLQIEDTGCGMDEATRVRIFDPFFSTKFTGRGLGLAAVQGILRSHKGGITVQSSPGQGTVFTVYLPCAAPAAGAPPPREGGVSPDRLATVLVVDDEPAVRNFAQAALERFGHKVLVAADGKQALDILSRDDSVELVLLDIVMPVLGGGEVLAEIGARWPRLAVLLTSGYGHEEAWKLAALSGELPFIEKPYSVRGLLAAVQKALDTVFPAGEAG